MEVKSEKYRIAYDEETATISLEGTLRLRNIQGDTSITDIFDAVIEQSPPCITLNLSNLKFINSSGLGMLFGFVVKIRDRTTSQVVGVGSKLVSWQSKTLKNLQQLMPELELRWV